MVPKNALAKHAAAKSIPKSVPESLSAATPKCPPRRPKAVVAKVAAAKAPPKAAANNPLRVLLKAAAKAPPASAVLEPPASEVLEPPASEVIEPPPIAVFEPPPSAVFEPPAGEVLEPPAGASLAIVAQQEAVAEPLRILKRKLFDEALEIFCESCGMHQPMSKARVLAKGKDRWKCAMCHCKVNQLAKGFGTWPTESFKTVPLEQQQAFMRRVHNKSGPDAMVQMSESLEAYEDHQEYYKDGGAFQPLSFWQQQGYDSQAIAEKSLAHDIKDHPVLGVTYRVRIIEGGRQGSRGEKKGRSLCRKRQSKKTECALE